MCRCRFITCNKWTKSGGGDVDNGGGYPRVKEGVYGKSLYVPHGFAMNLKCSKEEKKKPETASGPMKYGMC